MARQEVVNWQEKLALAAKEAASVERPPVQSISLRAGVMKLGDVPLPGNQLDVIVAASVHENRYFAGKFNPAKLENPVCYAFSVSGAGMRPHEDAEKPQADECKGCPMSQWGSADTGKGKACKEVRKFALIPADTSAEKVPSADVAMLTIPVTSVKNWSKYVQTLSASKGLPGWAVRTRIKVVPDAKSQFQVQFEYLGDLDGPAMFGVLEARMGELQDLLMRPYENSSEEDSTKL